MNQDKRNARFIDFIVKVGAFVAVMTGCASIGMAVQLLSGSRASGLLVSFMLGFFVAYPALKYIYKA